MRLFFEIWYADGSVSTGKTLDDWIFLPGEDVLIVVEVFDRIYKGKYACIRHAGEDYYWWHVGGIGAGSAKYIPADALIKRGAQVDDETWCRLYNAACIDPEVNNVTSR